MGDKDKQKSKARVDKSFELLAQSFVLRHFADGDKALIYKEKSYGFSDEDDTAKIEMQRLHFCDVFEIGEDFDYSLVLAFNHISDNFREGLKQPIAIEIDRKTLMPRIEKSYSFKGSDTFKYIFVLSSALLKKAINNDHPGYIRLHGFPMFTDCTISFETKGKLIKDVASFSISVLQDRVNFIDQGYPYYFASDKRLLHYIPHTWAGDEWNMKKLWGQGIFSPDPLYSYRFELLCSYNKPIDSNGAIVNDPGDILFKFFNINPIDPQPDDHYGNAALDLYDCSFIKTCEFEGDRYFRLVDPRTLPITTIKRKMPDGQTLEESFFALSDKFYSQDPKDSMRKFYLMVPMENDVLGIKTHRIKPHNNNPAAFIFNIANTQGIRITTEFQNKMPLSWRKNIKFNSEANTYTKIDNKYETLVYYPDARVMLRKEAIATFGKIRDCYKQIEATRAYSIESISNYYCTLVEYKPRPGYEHIKVMEGVTVDVWDCVKHVVKSRIGWTEADFFLVIQYTTGEDVVSKSWGLQRKFQQNTLCVKNQKEKLDQLETGIIHKISREQLWGSNRLTTIDGTKTDGRLRFCLNQGTDLIVLCAVKNNFTECHMLKVTGQLMPWWGRPYNY